MAAMNSNRWVARLASSYRNSAVRRFLVWWGQQLASFLPVRLREWFVERRDQLLVQRQEAHWMLRRSDAIDAVELLPIESDAETLRDRVSRLRRSGETLADLVYLLPSHDVLQRRLSLPMAAEENLAQVIAFELDRQTPFRADQVRYDYRVVRRDVAAKLLQVDVLLAPKSTADSAIVPLTSADLATHAIDGDDGSGMRLGFNLMPLETRAARDHSALRLNLILGAVCLVLLGLVMHQSVVARTAALEALQADVTSIQVEAKQTAALGTTLKEAVEGANFLASRKKEHTVAIDILKEVTEKLPKHTSLVRMSINDGKVDIQGVSQEAASLISILQKSKTIEAPALQGAITQDARTQKEQFLIQARARVLKPASADTKEGANAAATKS